MYVHYALAAYLERNVLNWLPTQTAGKQPYKAASVLLCIAFEVLPAGKVRPRCAPASRLRNS